MIDTALAYMLLFVSLYFEIFLLVAFLERTFLSRSSGSGLGSFSHYPSVAIIVPCYNEELTVSTTVASLLALEYPKDKLEVIVVDDGSKDRTLEIAKQFETDARVRVFHKENGGKHTAMNFGLARTNAELIGCLDADSVVASDGLLSVVSIFEDTRVAAITPGIHVKETNNILQHMQKVEYRLAVFNRFMLAALGSAFITPGPFSIFRTSVVSELGGWRHGYSTEDMEMALRIQNAGYLIGNAPRAVVHTGTPHTLKHLFRQRVRWTYGWLRNAVDYRHMIGNRKYGHMGLIILPSALISIGAAIFFFFRILFEFSVTIRHELLKIEVTGALPHPGFNLFYLNTSVMWILVWIAVGLILLLIAMGSFIGTGKRTLPIGTPLFVIFYSFLVPLWLGTAVVRAVFKTGVRWR
ncbi:MAG TPA: glycosyltransferase [Candidatus Paceibacterota bacterium]|jgi:cellulose synthase/poly-beta-1,6-N-acetylglucosamine synthase-like glycosyltransferase|nr:glycosyltransferase [Candidatus Paceibacterota bacterium]